MAGYGKTLALTSDGDLKLNELHRLEWITGTDVPVQRLKVTLATLKGEDPFAPEHGLDLFAATGTSDSRLRLEIVEALSRDKDVQTVNEVEIDRDGGSRSATVNITVTLSNDSQVSFPASV